MAHVPHLFLPAPWEADTLVLENEQVHHLRRVLRAKDHTPVTYTDGRGCSGVGTLVTHGVRRGDESTAEKPSPVLTVAVAPPRAGERGRFIVEKLAELGVDRLVWLTTEYGQAKPPRPERAARWAIGALEQSRGSWLMEIEGPLTLHDLPGATWILDSGGGSLPEPGEQVTLAIGPEGGFSAEELAGADITVGIGARVLRVETAAVVASGLVLDHLGRMNT
jgi:16S rRNA (uracil1498-N3)-methyltransferase